MANMMATELLLCLRIMLDILFGDCLLLLPVCPFSLPFPPQIL
jgi:hypothetical protein